MSAIQKYANILDSRCQPDSRWQGSGSVRTRLPALSFVYLSSILVRLKALVRIHPARLTRTMGQTRRGTWQLQHFAPENATGEKPSSTGAPECLC